MVHKCDLLTSVQLDGLYKRKSSLILEALINNVLLLSVNDTLYDPSEIILELMATRWSCTTSPREYTIQYRGRVIIYDGRLNELLDLSGGTSDNIRMTIYFGSMNPFLIEVERKAEISVSLQ